MQQGGGSGEQPKPWQGDPQGNPNRAGTKYTVPRGPQDPGATYEAPAVNPTEQAGTPADSQQKFAPQLGSTVRWNPQMRPGESSTQADYVPGWPIPDPSNANKLPHDNPTPQPQIGVLPDEAGHLRQADQRPARDGRIPQNN